MQNFIKRHPVLLTLHRFVDEAVDVRRLVGFGPNLLRYFVQYVRYRRAGLRRAVPTVFFPKIHDATRTTAVDPHYFYQGHWAFTRIQERRPERHFDVGSQIDFVRYLAAVTPVVFIDIRPIELPLPNLECVAGSILATGYPDESVTSLSSLHVIEHIGLGRYGDPLDPRGSEKAAAEMSRILVRGGRLYLSTPVGKPRLCFNAHHLRSPHEVCALFPDLKLIEFSAVTDDRRFVLHADLEEIARSDYACGLFVFAKP